MSRRLGVDAWRSFGRRHQAVGYMPFFPGPGRRALIRSIRFICRGSFARSSSPRGHQLADAVNSAMPGVRRLARPDALNECRRPQRFEDPRAGIGTSRMFRMWRVTRSIHRRLVRLGASFVHGSHVPEVEEAGIKMQSVSPFASFAGYDRWSSSPSPGFRLETNAGRASLIVDTTRPLTGVPGDRGKIATLRRYGDGRSTFAGSRCGG